MNTGTKLKRLTLEIVDKISAKLTKRDHKKIKIRPKDVLKIIFNMVLVVILQITIYYNYMVQKTANYLKLLSSLATVKFHRFFILRSLDTNLGQKIVIVLYVILILSIPIGAYLISQHNKDKYLTQSPPKKVKLTEDQPVTKEPTAQPPSKNVMGLSISKTEEIAATPEPSVTALFGPTLSFKVKLEGRPQDDQSTTIFVGIAEGEISKSPNFLLSFSINLPKSGEFSGLSLAGLQTGRSYSALLKSSAQIATSSAFLASPIKVSLNSGSSILLLSGDLNEDNLINSEDLSIIQKSLGSEVGSKNWNENADFNKDGVINILDLALLNKNIGKEGASGSWAAVNSTSPSVLGSP